MLRFLSLATWVSGVETFADTVLGVLGVLLFLGVNTFKLGNKLDLTSIFFEVDAVKCLGEGVAVPPLGVLCGVDNCPFGENCGLLND